MEWVDIVDEDGNETKIGKWLDRDENGCHRLEVEVKVWPDDFMEEAAAGIISNASDWSLTHRGEWQDAARKWLNAYNK
jgi:hypothetical protein